MARVQSLADINTLLRAVKVSAKTPCPRSLSNHFNCIWHIWCTFLLLPFGFPSCVQKKTHPVCKRFQSSTPPYAAIFLISFCTLKLVVSMRTEYHDIEMRASETIIGTHLSTIIIGCEYRLHRGGVSTSAWIPPSDNSSIFFHCCKGPIGSTNRYNLGLAMCGPKAREVMNRLGKESKDICS